MSNQTTEELLLAGMERFTADVGAPAPGLPARAARSRRRRRIAKAAATAGTVVTAAAVIAAVAAAGPAPAGQDAQTAAYVVSRTENALATSRQNLIANGRVTASKGFGVVAASGVIVFGATGPSAADPGPLVEWVYGQRTKVADYAADGKLSYIAGTTVRPDRRLTAIVVDYRRKAWGSRTSPVLSPMPDQSACTMAKAASNDFLGLVRGDIAAALRAALSCGQYTLAGTKVVDGIEALELKPVPSADQFVSVTFWVDPASYLPVRSVATFNVPKNHVGRVQVDFRWLQPTAANVAKLAVTIPPGFTRESTLIMPIP